MPRISEQGQNPQMQQAAAGAAQSMMFAMQQEQEKKDRAFAQERFQFQKDQATIDNEFREGRAESSDAFRQQGVDVQRDSLDFNRRRAERGDVRADAAEGRAQESHDARITQVEMSADQEAMTRKWYVKQLQDHGASEEELAVLGNASMGLLEAATGRVMMQRELGDGAQKLEALTMSVIQAMNPDPEAEMDPNDPIVLGLQEGLQASVGTLEGQKAFRGAMIDQLKQVNTMKAEAKQRVAISSQLRPGLESLMQTLAPASEGVIETAFTLFEMQEIDEEELLGQLAAAVKDSRSGTTNRTLGEEAGVSIARGAGGAFGRGEIGEDELESMLGTGRRLGGGGQSQPQQPADRGEGGPKAASQEVGTVNYTDLTRAFGRDSINEAVRLGGEIQNTDKRNDFLYQRADALAREEAGGGAASAARVAEIMKTLVEIVNVESPIAQP